jgi:hypothetical protein
VRRDIRSIRDTIFSMNREHLSPDAVTLFEASRMPACARPA